jgi:hypothetical protein
MGRLIIWGALAALLCLAGCQSAPEDGADGTHAAVHGVYGSVIGGVTP